MVVQLLLSHSFFPFSTQVLFLKTLSNKLAAYKLWYHIVSWKTWSKRPLDKKHLIGSIEKGNKYLKNLGSILYHALSACELSHFSCVWLFVTLGTVAHQASLSMGFSILSPWSGLPCPPPGDLPDPGIEPGSSALQVDSLPLSHWGSPVSCLRVL